MEGRLGIPLSLAVHAGALAALMALSLGVPDDLPTTAGTRIDVFPPAILVAAAPPSRPASARRETVARPRQPSAAAVPDLRAPREVQEIVPQPFAPEDDGGTPCVGCALDDDAQGPRGPTGAIGGGSGDGTAGPHPAPVRVGGEMRPPRKVRHVDPVYPELARRAGATGLVILECVIDRDGRVRGVSVLRGHPLLDAAAVDAVAGWAYRPTLLNGVPVEIVMVVTVRFTTR